MSHEPFLRHLRVVEFGDRLATGLCTSLLARLGAEVLLVEPIAVAATDALHAASKWPHRAQLAAGKSSLAFDAGEPASVERLRAHLQAADVVVTSSDWPTALPDDVVRLIAAVPIFCDVTAFGRASQEGPWTDPMLQAFAGLMDTTGAPGGPPTATAVPITEASAALFAASGVLAALRGRERGPARQQVDVALFDAAFCMLSTFLPKFCAGGEPTRIGNRHPSMSPWNAYPAKDGWVLLCSASDDMWGRVCGVVGRESLKNDPRFAIMSGRVANADEADAAIEPWIAQHTVAECVERFTAAAVPCGPVYTIADLLADADLAARGAFVRLQDPATGAQVVTPGTPIRGTRAAACDPVRIPRRGENDAPSPASREQPASAPATAPSSTGVLDGLRVIEMGNYTTAPLAARNLASLGAYVVKVEPPGGELARAAPPQRDGQSYLCTFSNNDKRCIALDLQTEAGRALFRELLASADVFVENMKPGVLARFGFGPAQIAALNPRLVYCSVTGFGAGSALAQRPAMDATIQGMAGLMDLTRQDGVPYKVGVSIADIVGGQFALLAILAGLEQRARSGAGQTIDISMHEVTAWLTQTLWNGGAATVQGRVEQRDGRWVYASPDGRTVPVLSVSEVARHEESARRGVLVEGRSRAGAAWPLLACAIRMAPHPTVVRRAIGAVGADLDEVLRDWNIPAGSG